MEFKGTKGKWKRAYLEKTEFYNERNEIHYGNDGECVAEFIQNNYDAQLIAHAPEMLEMLQSMIEWFLKYEDSTDKFNPHKVPCLKQECIIENAKQLIQKATTI